MPRQPRVRGVRPSSSRPSTAAVLRRLQHQERPALAESGRRRVDRVLEQPLARPRPAPAGRGRSRGPSADGARPRRTPWRVTLPGRAGSGCTDQRRGSEPRRQRWQDGSRARSRSSPERDAGMGRSHAVRLAREGADVIVLDTAGPLPGIAYDQPTLENLDETVRLVEAEGRRAVRVDGRRPRPRRHARRGRRRRDRPGPARRRRRERRDLHADGLGRGQPPAVPGHHRHQRHRRLEHGDGRRAAPGPRRRRLGHPDQLGGRAQGPAVHGPLHDQQVRRPRHGEGLRDRAGPAQHPGQQRAPDRRRPPRWAPATCRPSSARPWPRTSASASCS